MTANIFNFIKQSEYFVFIDFKRDELSNGEYRGSLFVNQEIAISTFLGIQGVGFYEKGTKREGILDYQIYNAFQFEDGTEIITILDEETATWDKGSANEIALSFNESDITRNVRVANNPVSPLSDWYHIGVTNRNKNKHAFNCIGYVSKIIDHSGNAEILIPTCELIWSGYGVYEVNIVGGTTRELDAFWILHEEDIIRFQHRPLTTSNPKYQMPSLVKGEYIIEYTVLSGNFANSSQRYKLQFGGNYRSINVEPY